MLVPMMAQQPGRHRQPSRERGDFAWYLTAAFVAEHPELAWGVPEEE